MLGGVRSAAATFQAVGVAAPTNSGTLSNNNQADAVFTQVVTGAVAGNTAGFISPSFDITRRGYSPTCTALVRTSGALPTGARVFIGLIDQAPANANDHGGNHTSASSTQPLQEIRV